MSALVTGACGFVGSRLVARLFEAGQDVVALDDLSRGRPESLPPGVQLAELDVRDTSALGELVAALRPSTVFHLAAIHFVPACNADPPAALSVNVVGTQSLLTALERSHLPQSLVLASTGAVYKPSERAHHETSPLAPDDVYGHSKLWSEQAVRLWERRTGVPVGIARLFNVIGPGETNPHLVPEIVTQAARGDELRLGNLDSRRDYVFVDDVAAGLQALPGRPATVNLGSGEAVDGHTLVRELGRALGKELRVVTDTARLRPTDRPVLLSDPSGARELVGWTAVTSLREALAAVARGY
ncbi:MAG TPA: NAD-dependent epimerase/dehydratase family protein [Thermoleophilaceae bacterium]|nr:NAD-dependent epimerase/dehydratase family protein [Thermoleophilaceae bacterium]